MIASTKIANISLNLMVNLKKMLSDTKKNLGKSPFLKKSEAKFSLECPFNLLNGYLLVAQLRSKQADLL
jgi:hypothetical protein